MLLRLTRVLQVWPQSSCIMDGLRNARTSPGRCQLCVLGSKREAFKKILRQYIDPSQGLTEGHWARLIASLFHISPPALNNILYQAV